MDWLHDIFHKSPEIALFLSLAVGYLIGQIRFGKFQLGGVGGSLLAAVVISQAGVTIDNGVKSVMFALFIYAVGYDSGPQFFNSLNRKTLREIAMALFLAVSALATVVVCAKLFGLNKGLAAGLAGGALTQSAIIGTAGDAIARLGLPADQVKSLQSDVAIAYAVTYVFGSLGAIIVCVNILPKFMGQSLRDASIDAEKALAGDTAVRGPGQITALPELVGRAYRVGPAAGRQVAELELSQNDTITIERIRRAGKTLEPRPDIVLLKDDIVLIAGRRDGMVGVAALIGPETGDTDGISLVMQTRQGVFTRKGMNHTTIAAVRTTVDRDMRHGVFIESATRAGQPLPVLPETKLEHGDVITFYGSPKDTKRAVDEAGYELPYSNKTDFIYMGVGLVLGLLIGLIVVRMGGIPLTLGSGGGCLLAGLLFGWMRGKHPMYGVMPSAASRLLQDFGLASFVAVVGLNSGLQAVVTVRQSGITIFLLGVFVTLFPLLLTMLFGRYVLRYNNAALLAGALSGSRSANPAFGGVLDKAESAVPTVPFAITYAIANVLLTLLGPLVVGLV
ncbi:aspartate-alanine antiporter [Paraburkholderia gardini]|uniref:Aspartate/alanine antiporter n=1 Tax=Paraburkholderia gardini TaxID=2823469 RepID=A0ABN7QEE1_9BURK|nr:aspartate-alanine antiporter [Paraburkholderia gardini]CAG4889146.1 Aspartate/alanine antiporter [Paraburkholderia gardini]